MIDQIQWLGHATFIIQGPPLIYINPWRVTRSAFHADAILIGHDGYETCSPADISKLRGESTIVVGNASVAEQVEDCTILRPWHTLTVGSHAAIKAIPAYTSDVPLRGPESGGLGFVISINYHDIYYAGTTGLTEEMDRIRPDIAIFPVSGHDTMTIEQVTDVVKAMRPRYVIPSHWGGPGAGPTRTDLLAFKSDLDGWTEVIVPQQPR